MVEASQSYTGYGHRGALGRLSPMLWVAAYIEHCALCALQVGPFPAPSVDLANKSDERPLLINYSYEVAEQLFEPFCLLAQKNS